MQSVKNDQIRNYDSNPPGLNVVATATYSLNTGTNVLTVTDASTVPSPDAFDSMHVEVYDKFGGKVTGVISSATGNVAINVATLNRSEGLAVTVTLATSKGIGKDGSANIADGLTAGNIVFEK
jgi:hypothetical protein